MYAFLLPAAAARAGRAPARACGGCFRWLRQPLVAIPVWILILYGWHLSFAFEAALDNDLVHALQHQTFVIGAVLVWWSVIEPKRRRLPADLWKVPYVLGARLAGMFLGMAFILMRTPAYGAYAERAPEHGISAITDQQVAGGMMLGLDLLVMLFTVGLFFLRSSEESERADRTAAVAG